MKPFCLDDGDILLKSAMTEYPQRSCGLCPYLAKYDAVANRQGDYLQRNTVPKPEVLYDKPIALKEHALGIPSTNEHPNLGAPVALLEPGDCIPSIVKSKEQTSKHTPHAYNPDEKKAKSGETTDNQMTFKVTKPNETCPCEEKLTSKPKRKQENEAKVSQVDGRRPACYLPQPDVAFPIPEKASVGAWATGRADWSPLAGLTGTRPIVDKYSIARFSEGEWRRRNKQILDGSDDDLHRANLINFNAHQALEQTRADTDKNQENSTGMSIQRELELHRWKCELERAIDAAAEEISSMERERRRLKHAMVVLMMPKSIVGECLDRRTGRFDAELVRDEVEEELMKEMALIAEIREVFNKALRDVEAQLFSNKTSKQRLEYDWSDKREAHDIEVTNVALNNNSNVMLSKPGAVRFPENQSFPEHWENFTRETLQESEATRQRSVILRRTLDGILTNAARDLRSQAERVDAALSTRMACTQQVRTKLESQLIKTLRQLADVEDLIRAVKDALRRMDVPMKKAQTRLDNRNRRPRVENCRDVPQFELVAEVKGIAESVAALASQLDQAERSRAELIESRYKLEREIIAKRKTLEINRDRIQAIRNHYPSATALTGH